MGWKNLPAWLKGGFLGAGSGLIYFFLIISLSSNSFIRLLIWPYYEIGRLILERLPCNDVGCMILIYPIYLILSILTGFIIGLFIGWIIGKIKSKKQQ